MEDALAPIMIAIPDDCKPLADAVRQLVARTEQARERARSGRAVDYAHIEREVGAETAAVERAAHQSILPAFDLDASAVVIEGQVHRRVCRSEVRYYKLAGDVMVARSLYRVRVGKVVDPIGLRVGVLDGGSLPETAAPMAHLLRQGTSRER